MCVVSRVSDSRISQSDQRANHAKSEDAATERENLVQQGKVDVAKEVTKQVQLKADSVARVAEAGADKEKHVTEQVKAKSESEARIAEAAAKAKDSEARIVEAQLALAKLKAEKSLSVPPTPAPKPQLAQPPPAGKVKHPNPGPKEFAFSGKTIKIQTGSFPSGAQMRSLGLTNPCIQGKSLVQRALRNWNGNFSSREYVCGCYKKGALFMPSIKLVSYVEKGGTIFEIWLPKKEKYRFHNGERGSKGNQLQLS